MKEYLKPGAYEPSGPLRPPCWGWGVVACLLKNEPASQWRVARLTRCGVAVARASPNEGVQWRVLDPKRGDLPMARLRHV